MNYKCILDIADLSELIQAKGIDLPELTDIRGSTTALLRLQLTYLLDTKSLGHGDILGHTTHPLDAEDMLAIGVAAIKGRYKKLAGDWLELAMTESTYWEAKRVLQAEQLILHLYPGDEKVQTLVEVFREGPKKAMMSFVEDNGEELNREATEKYRQLCRGESTSQVPTTLILPSILHQQYGQFDQYSLYSFRMCSMISFAGIKVGICLTSVLKRRSRAGLPESASSTMLYQRRMVACLRGLLNQR